MTGQKLRMNAPELNDRANWRNSQHTGPTEQSGPTIVDLAEMLLLWPL